MAKYKIRDIKIGDEITYKNKYCEENFTTWKVINKLDKTLLVIEKIENNILEKE